MEKLLQKFKNVRMELLTAIQNFPVERRTKALFDKWSLKDVVAHLAGWDLYSVDLNDSLRNGNEPLWEPSVKKFNNEAVLESKDLSWEEAYQNFVESSAVLIESYKGLSADLWDKKYWKSRKHTPRNMLQIDIDHYSEHLPLIIAAGYGFAGKPKRV